MMTNIPLLFNLLLIIVFSLSQEDSSECGGNAISRNDCFALSAPNKYCCFQPDTESTVSTVPGSGKCVPIEREELKSSQNIDCGITDENYGKYEFDQYHPKQELEDLGFETCGKFNPQKKEDCTDYSEISNSCCLFNKGGTLACLHIGRKYIKNTASYGELSCSLNHVLTHISH